MSFSFGSSNHLFVYYFSFLEVYEESTGLFTTWFATGCSFDIVWL